jgi:hypothetical protein
MDLIIDNYLRVTCLINTVVAYGQVERGTQVLRGVLDFEGKVLYPFISL